MANHLRASQSACAKSNIHLCGIILIIIIVARITNKTKVCLLQRGERMTKADVQSLLDDADDNGDGKLDYLEVRILPMNMIFLVNV